MEKIRIPAVEYTVVDTVIETFKAMLSLDLTRAGVPTDPGLNTDPLVVWVNYAGQVVGTMSLHVSETFARLMAAAMLGIEASEVEGLEEINEVLGEMANIVGGKLKDDFRVLGLACVISTPCIARGSDSKIELHKIDPVHRWVFRHQTHELVVEIALQQNPGTAVITPGSPVPGDDQIGEKITVHVGIEKEALVKREDEAVPAEAIEVAADELPQNDLNGELRNLNLLLDVPLEVTVELGNTRKRIGDLLEIEQGSVIELLQLDGEPVNLFVNDTLVAKGELFVDNEKYGIRIVEMVTRTERFRSLR